MTRTRTLKRFAIGVAVACLSWTGVILAMPVASADVLSNGLNVTCTQDSDVHATCVVSGCPRVNGDYVVDAIHAKINGGEQSEDDFKCINNQTARYGIDNNRAPVNIGVQACRKVDVGSDHCTPYANYTFTPPAKPVAPPVVQPPVVPPPVVPPPVVVPDVPKAVAPTNAVTMNITVSGLNANVNIASTANIPGTCTYKATAPLLPAVNKSFDLGVNGTMSFSTLAPPLLSTYHVVLSCKGTFEGKSVEFGHVEQDVTATG